MKTKKMKKRNATFVEYALLVGLLAIGVAVAVSIFGGKLYAFFDKGGKVVEDVGVDVETQGKLVEVPK